MLKLETVAKIDLRLISMSGIQVHEYATTFRKEAEGLRQISEKTLQEAMTIKQVAEKTK